MATGIEKIINECKKELDEYFCSRPFAVWKEEDLQSHLYYLILKRDHRLYPRIHREFPIVLKKEPREWKGMLDLAVVEEPKEDFNLKNVMIDYAIELKFIRDYRTGKSPKSLKSFENGCIRDQDKLLSYAENFRDKTKKYFWAFRYVDKPQIDEVNGLMNGIEWGNVIWQYTESYTDGSECKTISK